MRLKSYRPFMGRLIGFRRWRLAMVHEQLRPPDRGDMAQMGDCDSPLDGVQVLLVEDHELVREVISRLLAEYGAEVTATSGVAAALKAVERERPNVVLSNIKMPNADGYSLIRALRALPRDRGGQTPAVALTGLSTDEDESRALRAGFQYYVPKPVDARTLVGVVAGLAARSAPARKNLRTP